MVTKVGPSKHTRDAVHYTLTLCPPYPDIAESVIRTNPSEDFTNGFFVACFLRKEATTDAANEQKRKLEDDAEASSSKKSKKKNKKKKKKAKANVEPSL
jgi:hypothetical protein